MAIVVSDAVLKSENIDPQVRAVLGAAGCLDQNCWPGVLCLGPK